MWPWGIERRRPPRPPERLATVRNLAAAAVVSAVYLTALELLAYVFSHDSNEKMNPNFVRELHGWVKDMSTLPLLCRWDCLWYVNIANTGYPGHDAGNTAFFPLYGWIVAWGVRLLKMPAAYAAVWLSRLVLPFSVALLRDFVRLSGGDDDASWDAVAVLLSAPTAYVIATGVAEGFFLFLTLAAIVLAKRGRPWWAMIPAFLAGLTRVHAFAFVLGLLAFGIVEAHRSERGIARLRWFAPAAACGVGILGVLGYLDRTVHDPLAFIHAQAAFGKPTLQPLGALKELSTYWHLFPPTSQGAFLDWIRLPMATAVIGSTIFFLVTRRWFEFAYTAGLNGMLVLSTYWGVDRYMVIVFPVCMALAALRRWRGVWYAYLLSSALLQSYMLLQYVMLRRPS